MAVIFKKGNQNDAKKTKTTDQLSLSNNSWTLWQTVHIHNESSNVNIRRGVQQGHAIINLSLKLRSGLQQHPKVHSKDRPGKSKAW